MKALVCSAPGHWEYIEQGMPKEKAGYSIVKIRRLGVCGTDIHAFAGRQPYFEYPRILGHEIAAEFLNGSAEDFSKGDSVSIIPYYSCGTCIACRRGYTNCCTKLSVCGVHEDGAMREIISVPNDSLMKVNGISLDAVALIEPFSIAAHGVHRANIKANEYLLIAGAGPIGLCLAILAKNAGAQIIILDRNEERLDFCTRSLKLDYTFNIEKINCFESIKEITKGDMCTTVIDATGNLPAINQGIQYLAHSGKYVLVGLQKESFNFSHPEFHKKEASLLSSRNATRVDFESVIQSIRSNLIDPQILINHRMQFEQIPNKFNFVSNPVNGVIKSIIDFD